MTKTVQRTNRAVSKEQLRTKAINVRVNQSEHDEVKQYAQRKHMSMARYVMYAARIAAHGEQPEQPQPESQQVAAALQNVTKQLWHIGRNVNQIAHRVNMNAHATLTDRKEAALLVRQCQAHVQQVQQLIDSLRNSK